MIAIDIGLKKIGIAWCAQKSLNLSLDSKILDSNILDSESPDSKILRGAGDLIIPLPAILRRNRTQAARDLDSVLGEKNARILIVGIANDEMKRRSEHFVSLLNFRGKVEFINEDLSSKEAEGRILEMKNRKLLRKNGAIDSISAMIILERYLAKNRHLHQ